MSKNKPNEEILNGLELEQTEASVEELVEEVEPKVDPVYMINNCKKLNIRKKPNKNSDVLGVVTAVNTLTIEEIKSKPEWVKVITDSGIEGYCMKQYVAVK